MNGEASTTIHVVWEWLDRPGLESGAVVVDRDRVTMSGIVVTTLDGTALRLRYDLHLDATWAFQSARLSCEAGQATTSLALSREAGDWLVNGQRREDLRACEDIDIMGSPSTNTLPVRRLPWRNGDSRVLTMAYIRLPDLSVQAVAQRYTCLSETDERDRRFEYTMPPAGGGSALPQRQFEYHSVESGFRAVLQLDADGLVLAYPPYWRRVR